MSVITCDACKRQFDEARIKRLELDIGFAILQFRLCSNTCRDNVTAHFGPMCGHLGPTGIADKLRQMFEWSANP